MKFLIDNALSPLIADGLSTAGHEAVHVRDLNMQAADDAEVFDQAAREGCVLVSADTDFGTLLALRESAKPSIILFRHNPEKRPRKQLALLLANLPAIKAPLEQGSIIIFEETRLRIRQLPIIGNDA